MGVALKLKFGCGSRTRSRRVFDKNDTSYGRAVREDIEALDVVITILYACNETNMFFFKEVM